MSVITDKRNPVSGGGYEAEVVNAQDYYAFGSIMPGRNGALVDSSGVKVWKRDGGSGYRYGFNGKENDNEVKGEGNQQDYGMRIYDPRLGRFLSVDPITKEYPELTPYQFSGNNPIKFVDLDGLEPAYPVIEKGQLTIRIARDGQLQKRLYGAEANYLAQHTREGSRGGHQSSIAAVGSTGTLLQVAGYVLAPFTEGMSLGLVAWGEGLETASTAATAIDEYSRGNKTDALITASSAVLFGVAGKKFEKLEKVGKLTKVEKTILSAGLAATSKLTEIGIDKIKSKDKPGSLPLIPDLTSPTPLPLITPAPESKSQTELKPKTN